MLEGERFTGNHAVYTGQMDLRDNPGRAVFPLNSVNTIVDVSITLALRVETTHLSPPRYDRRRISDRPTCVNGYRGHGRARA